ncbi:MAG: helix-turn-helix transcriptional regulator [Cellvibrionaceae bacterium]
METPGDRLRRARTLKKLSQAELANLVGCARSTYRRLEANEASDPSFSLVVETCKVLGLSLDYYAHGKGLPPDLSDRFKEAIDQVLQEI